MSGDPRARAGWQLLDLRCFTAPPADLRLSCAVGRSGDRLSLRYRLEDPTAWVLIPPASPSPARRDGLWQHTCLECFLARAGAEAYVEVNASPGGDWALYGFSGYRQGMAQLGGAGDLQLAIPPNQPAGVFELEATLAVDALLAGGPGEPLELAITAVLEGRDRSLLYWALDHGGAEADFHRRVDFQLRI